jgi:hypothetical protein
MVQHKAIAMKRTIRRKELREIVPLAGHGRACEAAEQSLRCPNRTSGEVPLR